MPGNSFLVQTSPSEKIEGTPIRSGAQSDEINVGLEERIPADAAPGTNARLGTRVCGFPAVTCALIRPASSGDEARRPKYPAM